MAFYEKLVGFARRDTLYAAFGGPFVLPAHPPLARSAIRIEDKMGGEVILFHHPYLTLAPVIDRLP